MERILVTGGAGFIGGYVLEEVRASGRIPILFDYRRTRVAECPPEAEFFLGDVRDEEVVTEAMAHADGWIHLAGVLGTQETVLNPRPAAVSNVLGGLNILEAAAQYGLPGVYICVGNHWMNNTYSITKTTVERFVTMYNKERGTWINMVRAVNAYGPRQVAAAPYGPGKVRKIVPAFVCRALSGQPIEVYGDGRQVSDMLYVRDLAVTLVRALEAAACGTVLDQAVEVGPVEHHTVRGVADLVNSLVAEYTGARVNVAHLPMRPGEVPGDRVTADVSTLAALELDAGEFLPLEEGMRRTVQYFVQSEGVAWHRGASSPAGALDQPGELALTPPSQPGTA